MGSLGGLFQACGAAAGQPGRKREMDDNSKRLAALFWRLNKGDVSEPVAGALLQLSAALGEGNYALAAHIQVRAFWVFCPSGAWICYQNHRILTPFTSDPDYNT